MILHRGPLGADDQALELAAAHALVRRAGSGEGDEVMRIYRPTAPVVVFGRRDTRLPGFPDAAAAARGAGFEPLVRATGGRAVAYTSNAIVVDHVAAQADAQAGMEQRFEDFGQAFIDVFRELGVDARLGAVPGEYCPGAHSVNARGVVKLVGTSQRVVRGAWLFSSLVVVGDEDRVRPVLTDVYRLLGQDFDGASVGSVTGEGARVDAAALEQALVDRYAAGVAPVPVDEATLALAGELVEQHRSL